MKRPLTGLVVVYALGIWLGSALDWPVAWLCAGVAICLTSFLLLRQSRYSMTALLLTVFVTGVLAYRFTTTSFSPLHISRLLEHRDQNIRLRGVIITDPGYREMESDERHSFVLELEALNSLGQWQPAKGRVMVFVSATREQEPLQYGDEIECSAILRVPPPTRNPGTFDWQRWLARQNIPFTATIRKADSCAVLAAGRGNPLVALSLRVRERFERALHVGLEGEPKLAGVLAGMIIGERAEIPPQTYADFQRTGVFHIFSVSGLNVTLVAVVVMAALRLVRVPSRWRGLLTIPMLILYVFATGGRPSAIRTLVMASVVLIGWALVRPSDILNSLAASALVILVYDPRQFFDGGFILSFVAVISMIILIPPIERLLGGWCSPDPLLPRQVAGSSWWRSPALWLMRGVSASIAAWIGMLPLMALYFNLFSPISILANIAVIPLLGLITALGMLVMPAHAVWTWLALTFNNANFFLLSVMIRAVEWLSRVPWGHQFVQAPPLWLIGIYYALIAVLLSPRLPRRYKYVLASTAIVVFGSLMLLRTWTDDAVEVTALDLRDGMSVFVNAPGQRNDWLVDGGGDWSGSHVVVPFLRAQGVDELQSLTLSRGDKAHVGGLSAVMENIHTTRANHSATGSRSKFFWAWLDLVRQRKMQIGVLREGDDRLDGQKLRVRVLNPPKNTTYDRSDDNSVVLLMDYGPTRLLLCSDIGATVEHRLVQNYPDLHADIIIKGRHSDESSCTDEFLAAVRPVAVVQCVNAWPSERYLQPELRDRLRQRNVMYYRTDETGAVTVRLTPRGYTIRTCFAAGPQIVKNE